MQLKPLDQQVVVLFGASSGIGRLAARRFALRGARVVVAARSEAGLHSLVEEITSAGGEALAIPADTTHFDQVQAVADGAVAHFGHLDTWVHLAAVGMYARFDEMTPEEWKQVIDINLNGQAYGAMAALPHLKREGRGALIHISSVLGERAVPLQSVYSASKHGMIGMLDALRVELMQAGIPISVTTVRPASINTPFFSKARTRLGVQPAPYPPVYQPDLVADAILFAATHPVRDIFVGDAAKILTVSNHIAPGMVDGWLRVTGEKWQRTSTPKSVEDLNSVFEPVQSYDRVEGDFGAQALPLSLYPWIEIQQVVMREIGRQVLIGAIGLLAEVLRPRRQMTDAREQPRRELSDSPGFEA